MPPAVNRVPLHYAWIIVLCGILILFCCLGLARFAFGMLLPSMREGLGLAYDQMGFISTGNFVGYLLSVALTPWLLRRLRPRVLIFAGLLLIGVCMFGMAHGQSYQTLLTWYALTGMGSGFANIPIMVLVSHWFRRERRGRAAGLMVMGNGLAIMFSGYFIPLLNQWLGSEGWRTAWLVLGTMTLTVALLAGLLVRNDPGELSLEPLGPRVPLPEEEVAIRNLPCGARIILQLGALYAIFGATYMIYGTFIVTTMVVEYGFAEAKAGLFWSWVGFFGLFSGVVFGMLSDRIGRRWGMVVVLAIQTLAYLLVGAQWGSAALLVSVVLYGLAVFAIPTIMAAAVGDYLGLSRAAAGFSTVTLFFAIGQTIGPGSAGLLAETSGSFTSSFLVAAALTGIGILIAGLLPRPHAACREARNTG